LAEQRALNPNGCERQQRVQVQGRTI